MIRMERNTLCSVHAAKLGNFVVSLPALATIITVGYSILYDFEGSTATHCGVRNVLPSISAAISRRPQCYVWRILIALHSAPRFMFAASYYGWFNQIHVGKRQALYLFLVKFMIFMHVIENLMLVLLSCVSSLENRNLHENSFVVFIVTSWIYMLLQMALLRWGLQYASSKNPPQLKAYRLQKLYSALNIGGFTLAVYMYFRHNWYCEPYVYSLFAFLEYATIFTNIFFHQTGVIIIKDFSAGVVLTDLIQKQR